MRWALLGASGDTEFIERRFAAAGIDLVRVPDAEWESLLVRLDFNAVFVDRGMDESLRSEQLKKLIGSGIPVVAMHPAVDVLTAYELEVIRRDSQGILWAFAPGWHHPAWDRLQDTVTLGDKTSLGRAEHISFERHVDQRKRQSAVIQLSQDVRILRRLLGNITSINAVGDSRQDGTWNSLTVHLVSDSGRSANWSIAPPSDLQETRIGVVCSQGNAHLRISGAGGPEQQTWEFRDSLGNSQVFSEWNDAGQLVEQLQLVTHGQSPTPSWSETCLDLEITEAAEKSLYRKRAVDLNTTNRSEEKTFKGFMAATGCLVLLAILVGFFGMAVWDGIRSPFREPPRRLRANERPPEKPEGFSLWVRLWPVYPLLAFLFLQFLLLIARRPGPAAAGTGPQKPPKNNTG